MLEYLKLLKVDILVSDYRMVDTTQVKLIFPMREMNNLNESDPAFIYSVDIKEAREMQNYKV